MPTLSPDPKLTKPELSNRFLIPALDLIEERYGPAWLKALCEDAGLPVTSLARDTNWVSFEFLRIFADKLKTRMEGREGPAEPRAWALWREAGSRSLQPRYIGPLYYLVRVVGSPAMAWPLLPKLIREANRSSQVEVLPCGPSRVRLIVRAMGGPHQDGIYACANRWGAFEALPTIWGLPPAKVTHPVCMHDPAAPGDRCEYVVDFKNRRLTALLPVLASSLLAIACGLVAWRLGRPLPESLWAGLALGSLSAVAQQLRARRRLTRERLEEISRLEATLNESSQRHQELWREQKALRRYLLVNRKIAEYLAADVVDEILRDPEKELRIGGVLREASVLFCDIVGFTSRCESMPPERVVQELNLFFRYMDECIDREGGIIDKRIGDGIMAVFVAHADEDPTRDIRRRAVRCALAMIAALPRCNQELLTLGSSAIQIRIGLASGPIVQGNMGSNVKLEYTVIGDIVNLASRLEGLALPGRLLMDRSTWEAAADLLGHVQSSRCEVRGRSHEIDVVGTSP